MSWLSGGELHSGAWTSSNYVGLGAKFENLPNTGDNGGSPLLNDGGVSGDEVRWELLTNDASAIIYEDGSFESGVGSFTYRSFVNNSAAGDFTVTVNADGVAYSLSCDTVTNSHALGDVTLTYTGAAGTQYILTCDTVTDSQSVGEVVFARGYVLQAGTVTDTHLALPVTLRYSGEEIALIGSYSVNYRQSDVAISYNQSFYEARYGDG